MKHELKSANFFGAPSTVDTAFLYRRPILDFWCECGESIVAIVQNVLLHTISHYFELSNADLTVIEFNAKVEADAP